MRNLVFRIMAIFILGTMCYADDGMINIKSAFDVKSTADRLVNTLKEKGMNVFVRINHAQGAKKHI